MLTKPSSLSPNLAKIQVWMLHEMDSLRPGGITRFGNPNNALLKREIPEKYHTFASSLISSKWIPFSDPCRICLQWILTNPYCWWLKRFSFEKYARFSGSQNAKCFHSSSPSFRKENEQKKRMNIHHPYAYIFDSPVGVPNGWEFSPPVGGYIHTICIYLEPKWPLFCLFCRVDLQK